MGNLKYSSVMPVSRWIIYPGTRLRVYISCKLPLLFLPHTYLVGATVIKKTVCYDSSPALHIAEARVIELPSGTSLAQFLMALRHQDACFHHCHIATCNVLTKTNLYHSVPSSSRLREYLALVSIYNCSTYLYAYGTLAIHGAKQYLRSH